MVVAQAFQEFGATSLGGVGKRECVVGHGGIVVQSVDVGIGWRRR